jgi:hypothetical protein
MARATASAAASAAAAASGAAGGRVYDECGGGAVRVAVALAAAQSVHCRKRLMCGAATFDPVTVMQRRRLIGVCVTCVEHLRCSAAFDLGMSQT